MSLFSRRSRSRLSFTSILRASLNCDPALVHAALMELVEARVVSVTGEEEGPRFAARKGKAARLSPYDPTPMADAPRLPPAGERPLPALKHVLRAVVDSLPEPSPVFCQWWFSQRSYASLVRLVSRLGGTAGPAAFLGCPTLGAVFSHFAGHDVSIFDADDHVLNSLRPVTKDARLLRWRTDGDPVEREHRRRYPLVFVDPPWSTQALPLMLSAGSSLLAPRGALVMSFPGALTRPSIEKEREQFVARARQLGLAFEAFKPGATEYDVPLFERLAYRHLGVSLEDPWRRGDLFLFRNLGKLSERPSSARAPSGNGSGTWEQFVVGKARLFLKRDGHHENGEPVIRQLSGMHDFLCQSVSSRCGSWAKASLVSTRNCFGDARGRARLSGLLRRVSGQNGLSQRDPSWGASCLSGRIREALSSFLQITEPSRGDQSNAI